MKNNIKMNKIAFDSYVRRDAYLNGFENYEPIGDFHYRFSSTAHNGVIEVKWDEINGFSIYFVNGDEEIIVGDLKNLVGAIREVLYKSLDYDKRVK